MAPTKPRRERLLERAESKPPTLWRAINAIVVVTVVFVVLAAVAMRLVEPETFTNMGDALWFSVVTVSTVGYGDIIPETGLGRFVAGVVMIFGLAFVPAVTSIVVAINMSRRRGFQDAGGPAAPDHPDESERNDGAEG